MARTELGTPEPVEVAGSGTALRKMEVMAKRAICPWFRKILVPEDLPSNGGIQMPGVPTRPAVAPFQESSPMAAV